MYYDVNVNVTLLHLAHIFIYYLAFSCVVYCQRDTWRVIIQKKGDNSINIAEVHFYYKSTHLIGSLFNFTATSYVNSIIIGNHGVSGPPEAANDNNINTFYHSGYDDKHGGYTGKCCPDTNPALIITTRENITFDTLRIFNRQDVDGDEQNYFSRLIGATVSVYDSEETEIFRSEIKSGLSTYTFKIRDTETSLEGELPTRNVPPAWREFIDEAPGSTRKAILISGGLHRFIFRQSRIAGFEKGTDVFIHLHNDGHVPAWNAKVDSSLPYDSSPSAIKAYFSSLGAESVHVIVYDASEIAQLHEKMDVDVGPDKILRIKKDSFAMNKLWVPHSVMYALRHLAFKSAMQYAASHSFNYTHFIYQRDDNVYYGEDQPTLPTLPGFEAICVHPASPCVAVSMYCHFNGFWSDKIYYTNQLGAAALFGRTWRDCMAFLGVYLDSYKPDIPDGQKLQTEAHAYYWLTRYAVSEVHVVDFQRTEMRFVGGQLCVVSGYDICGAAGFLDTPWMQELNFTHPCSG